MRRLAPIALSACLLSTSSFATDLSGIREDWVTMPDAEFAETFAPLAFSQDLSDRELAAWLMFARISQLIKDPDGPGMSGSGHVRQWMAWPTDPDTFASSAVFAFDGNPRNALKPSTDKADLNFGKISRADPNGANEEVTRNETSYDYLTGSGLTTKAGVATYFDSHKAVEMPLGSIELKISWLQVTEGSPAPDGALTFTFDGDITYWWRGVHIMMKMREADDPTDIYYSEDPTWFWTTFEFNRNLGTQHVRNSLITQRSPLSEELITEVLDVANIEGFGFEEFGPNGTQIRFTVNGTGETPIILGHTDMEDFAGSPNTAQPQYWTSFQSSCHSCHATAAYNPETKAFFPFSVPKGILDPSYRMTDSSGATQYLGQGYLPLDFMWPIAFQAK